MAVLIIFKILIALFVLGVIGAFVALIVLAIAKGRGGAALVAGGLAFVGLLVGAALLSLFVGYSTVKTQSPGIVSYTFGDSAGEHIQWESSPSPAPPIAVTTDSATWSIGLSSMFFVLLGVGGLLAYATRHGHGHAVVAGHQRAWPLVLGFAVLGFLLLGGLRYQTSRLQPANSARTRAIEQMTRIKSQQQEQQKAMADRVATIEAKAKESVDSTDIHELMEKVNAPRIAIPESQAPSASSAELVADATASSGDDASAKAPAESDSKSASVPSAKSRSSSKQKHPTKATPAAEKRNGTESNVAAEVPLPSRLKEAKESGKATPESSKAAAPARPAWVDATPVRAKDLRQEVIVTEEYESTDECFRAAEVYLMLKAYDRLQQLLGKPHPTQDLPSITFHNDIMLANGEVIYGMANSHWSDARLSLIDRMGMTPETLRNEIVSKDRSSGQLHEYIEKSDRSVGTMQKLHTQIEFTPETDRQLMRRWDAQIREDRFAYVGLGAGSVLGMLGMVWGLLKLDTATKGYYSKWLFIGVPAAIIGVASWALAVTLL